MAVWCPRFCAPHTRSRGQIKHSHNLAQPLFRKAIPSLIEDKSSCRTEQTVKIPALTSVLVLVTLKFGIEKIIS